MTLLADAELTQVASHLMARYAWAIDDRAYDDLVAVFTPDVHADYGPFRCAGAEELALRMRELHDGLRSTQHLIGSVLARGEPDGSVSVRSHVRATLVRASGEQGRVEVAASYRDVLLPSTIGYRIAQRRVVGLWIAGERSILPWLDERLSDNTGDGSYGASSMLPDAGRVDRFQTASAAPHPTRHDDRGI